MAVMRYKKPDGSWGIIRGASGTGGEYFTFHVGFDANANPSVINSQMIESWIAINTDGKYDELIALANQYMEENESIFSKIKAGEKISILADSLSIFYKSLAIEFDIEFPHVDYLSCDYSYVDFLDSEELYIYMIDAEISKKYENGEETEYELVLYENSEFRCPPPGEASVVELSNIYMYKNFFTNSRYTPSIIVKDINEGLYNTSHEYLPIYVDTNDIGTPSIKLRWWYDLKLCESTINGETGEATTTVIKDLGA